MKEQLVTFETAKVLYEVGFNWECPYAYDDSGRTDSCVDQTGEGYFNEEDILTARENEYMVWLAPTQSLVQKWLRETHDIYIEVCSFKYKIKELNSLPRKFWFNIDGTYSKESYGSWEKALEEGLMEGLNKLKIKLGVK